MRYAPTDPDARAARARRLIETVRDLRRFAGEIATLGAAFARRIEATPDDALLVTLDLAFGGTGDWRAPTPAPARAVLVVVVGSGVRGRR